MRKRSWSELTDSQKTWVLVAASVEMSLTATAVVDLVRRPSPQVHGSKGRWALVLLAQPVGPVLYLWRHRRQ